MTFLRAALLTGVAAASTAPATAAARPPAHAQPQSAERGLERPVRPIALDVNGAMLETAGPIVENGRVLLPLREVFAALGIALARSGDAVTAQLPIGALAFRVGASSATVGGRAVALDAPTVERAGTLYGSLRLVTSSLGAQAAYDQRAARVDIVSSYLGRNSDAEQSRGDGGSDVQGIVSAIDSDSQPPSITVVRSGESRTISVTSDAKIWTEDVTIHSQVRGALAALRVGDALHAILARDGRVVSLYDYYRSATGTIAATSPAAFVLASGQVVTPSASTEITLDGAPARVADLRDADAVTIRSNPESGELRQIVASRPGAAPTPAAAGAAGAPATANPVQIASVALSSGKPLRTGESVAVTLHGTPGGSATYALGDYLTGLPMTEQSPGFYVARFTVPDRFNVVQLPVYGELTAHGTAATRVSAPQTLSAATTPPVIGEVAPPAGRAVNNSRPSIFATFLSPTEIGIAASTATMTVNGHDVTSSTTRLPGFITYSPGVDIPSGPVTIVVRVADDAGNPTSKSWTFTITSR